MRDRLPLVLSITALLVAVLGATPLGRAAYDAVVIPKHSVGTIQLKRAAVGSAQLKHNAVTASRIAPNAIRTGQIVNGSLLAEDFKPDQLPQGPKGDKGDKGAKGDPGESATKLWASIASTGTIVNQQGATASAKIGTGSYIVDFDQDVSKCAVLATQSFFTNGYASARPDAGAATRVRVSTWATSSTNVPVDASFYVAVFC
jgi:hypothetical protein